MKLPEEDLVESQVEATFARAAVRYDYRWAKYTLGTHQATVDLLDLRGDEEILDVGCGTGELERHLLCRWPRLRIVAVDLCQEMLGHARTKFSPELSVSYARASAESLPFDAARFDAVISCNAFHFTGNRTAALKELARVLKPNGRLVITDWCADYLLCRLLDAWLHATGRGAEGRVLGSSDCSRLLEQTRFHAAELKTYRVGWFWGMMTAVARKLA